MADRVMGGPGRPVGGAGRAGSDERALSHALLPEGCP
jgi:hypothetical protein